MTPLSKPRIKCRQCEMPLLKEDSSCPFCGKRIGVMVRRRVQVQRGLFYVALYMLFEGLTRLFSSFQQVAGGDSRGLVVCLAEVVILFAAGVFLVWLWRRTARS